MRLTKATSIHQNHLRTYLAFASIRANVLAIVFLFSVILMGPFVSSLQLHRSPLKTVSAQAAKQNGLSYAEYAMEDYSPAAIEVMLAEAQDVGANAVTFVVTRYQYDLSSTIIYPTVKTASDADLGNAVGSAHELGLQVVLKPHVDIESSPIWRGNIGQGFDEGKWAQWFAGYQIFLNHYADLAQELEVDLFVVGTELRDTSQREVEWRNIIAEVRQRYSGPLTYSANHSGEEININWWDALDYIGISAYYPLSVAGSITVSTLKDAWQPHISALNELADRWNRSIIFTEIGYRSSVGANEEPWCSECSDVQDLQLQADAYQAFYNAVYIEPWLAGMYWWGWTAAPAQSGPCNNDYSPFNKPAENILRANHGRNLRAIPTSCDSFATTPAVAPTEIDEPEVVPPQASGFEIIESFDRLETGLLNGQNGWLALGNALVVDDPASEQGADPNQVLQLKGENALAHHVLPFDIVNSDAAIIENASGFGTIHFRMLRDGDVDVSTGGSDESNPRHFSSFEPQFGVQSSEPETFKARNSNAFVPLTGTFVESRWYCVWIVANMNNETVELTVQGGEFPDPTQLSARLDASQSTFNFRNGGVDAIRTFYIRTGWDTGSHIYIDDLYADAGSRNLSSPVDGCNASGQLPNQTPVSTPTPTPMLGQTPTSAVTPTPTIPQTPTAIVHVTSTPLPQPTIPEATTSPNLPQITVTPTSTESPTIGAEKAYDLYLPYMHQSVVNP